MTTLKAHTTSRPSSRSRNALRWFGLSNDDFQSNVARTSQEDSGLSSSSKNTPQSSSRHVKFDTKEPDVVFYDVVSSNSSSQTSEACVAATPTVPSKNLVTIPRQNVVLSTYHDEGSQDDPLLPRSTACKKSTVKFEIRPVRAWCSRCQGHVISRIRLKLKPFRQIWKLFVCFLFCPCIFGDRVLRVKHYCSTCDFFLGSFKH